ncbi:hypothetical protein [Mucilaginibacter flavidus]|uniref:hypothetical protein n=1 Tax=Mucilaginibacter flavidus TaxID=2949309 RepID=UPI002092DAF8|nr:hypothetical protein [Mucilaginibacter flavidus]
MKNNPSLVLSRFVSEIDLPNYRVPDITYCYTFKKLSVTRIAEPLFSRLGNERGEFVFVNALNGIMTRNIINGRSLPKL